MNRFTVSVTPPNTRSYPIHRHGVWEIMYYLEGEGYMATERGEIPFERGSIIIVPPETPHGSVSENGFVNISVAGDFSHLLMFDAPVRLRDGASGEGETLARMILNNRYAGEGYLSALCIAYASFLLQSAACESPIERCVRDIVKEIEKGCADPSFCVTELLKESGYAEDYIRAEFKKVTRTTPIRFLTKIRVDRAKSLLDIYGKSRTLTEIAAACGFDDVIYFSKKFKELTGQSPDRYRREPRGE